MKKSTILLLSGIGIVLLCTLYSAIDPETSGFTPRCLFHELTGWQCPGCGSQRMLHALLHGDIAAAWHYNALLLCLIPLLIPMICLEIFRDKYPRLYMKVHSIPVVVAIVTIIILWWIFRIIYNF